MAFNEWVDINPNKRDLTIWSNSFKWIIQSKNYSKYNSSNPGMYVVRVKSGEMIIFEIVVKQ